MNRYVVAFIVSLFFLSCTAIASNFDVETTSANQTTQDLPLKVSALSDEAVLSWANKQVIAIYTFYFEDIEIWRKKIKPYFSSKGYKDFLALMQKSETLKTVKEKKLIVQPKLDGESTLVVKGINKGILNDVYTWYVVVPVHIIFLGPFEKIEQNFLVRLEIIRQNNTASDDGIVINGLKVYSNDKTDKSMKRVIDKISEESNLYVDVDGDL